MSIRRGKTFDEVKRNENLNSKEDEGIEMPKAIVCVKQVIDPEAPTSTFQIDPAGKRALAPAGSPPVISPYDANALEAALRLKDEQQFEIIVISMGRKLSKPVLQKALACGADQVILLQDESFDLFDSYATASVLAAAIKKIGAYDLILCGRQASDTNAGQVGIGIAALLDLPCITVARSVAFHSGTIQVERRMSDGYETIEASAPAVITADSEIGNLRIAPVKAVMASRKAVLPVWTAGDLGISAGELIRTEFVALSKAESRAGKGVMVQGTTPAEAGESLATVLMDSGMI
ncbi:MAG TPA: electron transfer flavoprotein subunit beta/FixA family protein [Thermodesulfobacteriota bacterium]|nr:electron transfer flavoprotein subunit beta/FixA family protein [Thermodesulfobacteriota bacterium]HNU71660.1 electron transfer flavoprotein subunit beta/FixA family protein [Thermodesulfobacteriota bacterium]